MSDRELLSPDNSGSSWDKVLLAQKIDKQGGCNMSWCAYFEKVISRKGHLFQTGE